MFELVYLKNGEEYHTIISALEIETFFIKHKYKNIKILSLKLNNKVINIESIVKNLKL